MAEPPPGQLGLDQSISRSIQRYGDAESPSPRFGKADLDAARAQHSPRRLGSTCLLAEGLFSKFMCVDKPKSGGKAALWHPRGMEQGSPGRNAPRAPRPATQGVLCCYSPGWGKKWLCLGASCPCDTLLVLLRPLLTFVPPQQQGEQGRQCPRAWGACGQWCRREGGEQRRWCLLNIAGRTGSGCPGGSITQLSAPAGLLPVLPGVRVGPHLAAFRRVLGAGWGSVPLARRDPKALAHLTSRDPAPPLAKETQFSKAFSVGGGRGEG